MSNAQNASVDPLLGFRLAYLRALAASWQDPAVEAKLLASPDIQDELIEYYGLTTRWRRLAIRLNQPVQPRDQTRWNPALLTGGWIGQDDQYVLALPQRPSDDREMASALAAYYQLFPDVMGESSSKNGIAEREVDIGSGPFDLIEFGRVVAKAIALAWQNPEFKAQLLAAENAESVLSQWFLYNNPFNFEIRFVDTPSFTWVGAGPAAHWNLEGVHNTIVLNYPNRPNTALETQPIALAAYNETGSAYPFTC